MKTKLLKRLRKLAKKAITIKCEVFRNDIKYTIYKNKSYYCYCNSKGDAIDNLIYELINDFDFVTTIITVLKY